MWDSYLVDQINISDLVNVTHHILAHTLAPIKSITTVQEEGLTNDLHKQAHDKKNISESLNVYMSKLGYRLTASEVGVFSRENLSTLPFFEEPL